MISGFVLNLLSEWQLPNGATAVAQGALTVAQSGVCLEAVFSGLVGSLGGLVGVTQATCETGFDCVPCGLGGSLLKGCPPSSSTTSSATKTP